MDSNVTKYEVMISEAIRAERDVARKEKALEKSKGILVKRMVTLKQDCKKCFDEAVLMYNKDTKKIYEIFETSISIDLESVTLSAWVRLKYSGSQREPDEFFGEFDHTKILLVLKPLVDEELKKQGIPLTFQSFGVPIDYYPI